MPYKEFEGKTIDKAVKIACTELNISKSEIKYDVISKGSNSIFGLVSIKKAKIKVTLPKNGSQPKHDKDSAKSLVDMAFSESKYDDQPSKKEKIEKKEKKSKEEIIDIPDDIVLFGKESLQKIIDLITEDAEVIYEIKNNSIMYEVKGGNAAILIGKRGQNLEAMQYLL